MAAMKLQHDRPVAPSRSYALGLLVAVYTVNMIDRQILAILGEPIRVEFALSDGQLGLLTGFAFVLLYAVAGLPIAWAADRMSRRIILALSLAFWSAMTAVSGLSRSFEQLALARLGVGLGEAGCGPPSHSLIADLYPAGERARALGIYGLGIPIGTLFALSGGGWIAAQFGWREALFVVGLPGLLLAVVVLKTLPEPQRGATEDDARSSIALPIAQSLRYLLQCKTFIHVAIGGALATGVGASIVIWAAPFLLRTHDMGLAQAGLMLGIIAGIPGAVGMYCGGALADYFGANDIRWRLQIVSVALILSCPFAIAAWLVPGRNLSLALLIVPFTLCTFFYQATSFAQIQSISPLGMRATAAAALLLVMNIVGQGGGPLLVGLLSDQFYPYLGADSLRGALSVMSIFAIWAAWHYWRAGQHLAADYKGAIQHDMRH